MIDLLEVTWQYISNKNNQHFFFFFLLQFAFYVIGLKNADLKKKKSKTTDLKWMN